MKLLIAEDEKSLNDVITKKLTHEGFSVDSCFNGADALDRLLYADYDLAVLDIMMPEMSGTDVVTNLRREGKQTPVIFLTAKDTISDRVAGLNLGASDYIVKPFLLSALYAKCSALLKRTERITEKKSDTVLSCGAIQLNTRTLTCFVYGNEIELTPKAFAILHYLMEHPGWAIDRDTLLDNVWGEDYFGADRVVDNHIKRLRKALGNAGSQIHTVIGRGYKLTDS